MGAVERILAVAFTSLALQASLVAAGSSAVTAVCQNISAAISSSSTLSWPGSILYTKDISHWAVSSSDTAGCSVEPGTAADLSTIIQILGSTKTPFAVKGGGHASNPGFSSTTGVQIAMYKFSDVVYHADTNTAEVGAGLIWDDVYSALEPFGVNVIGGRVTGVGVAGFTLGGGYSWKSNQYGLTIDNIVAYELVLPSGTITTVTETSNPDLWFGLRGGFNNFGIVTKFTLKTYPQGQVWGGLINYPLTSYPAVTAATLKFSNNVTDPKASIITTYNAVAGAPIISQLIFYDGPTPPAGIFDDFLAAPALTTDIKTRSFLSLVTASPANATAGQRGFFNTVSLKQYTPNILNVIQNETLFYGNLLNLLFESQTFISYDVEPFLPTVFSHGSASAYPPDRSQGLLPLNIYAAWLLPIADAKLKSVVTQTATTIRNAALAEGQDIANAALYPNYAIYDTPLSQMYGSNLARLQSIKAQYDPTNVMGLAGGWKF